MSSEHEDLSLKFRMTGAVVWLLLLIIIVPIWYSHPVNFTPDNDSATMAADAASSIVVDKPFLLPDSADKVTKLTVSPPATATLDKPLPEAKSSSSKKLITTTKAQVESAHQAQISHKTPATPVTPGASVKTRSTDEQWILRIAAYHSKEKANQLYEHLKYDYDVFIKYFPNSRYYSVRIGPYQTKQAAIKDQSELNRVLHIHSELAKLK